MSAESLDLVCQEMERQKVLWGVQDHTKEKWAVILGEEYGEVCKAIYDCDDDNYEVELVQVAAVAISALENWRYQRRQKEHAKQTLRKYSAAAAQEDGARDISGQLFTGPLSHKETIREERPSSHGAEIFSDHDPLY